MISYPCDLFTISTPATHMMLGYMGDDEIIYLMDDAGTILRREIGTGTEMTQRYLDLRAAGVKYVDEYGWNALRERANRNRVKGTKK